MTPEERAKIKEGHTLGYSPSQILRAIRTGNPNSALIPRDIYNLLASLRIEELNGQHRLNGSPSNVLIHALGNYYKSSAGNSRTWTLTQKKDSTLTQTNWRGCFSPTPTQSLYERDPDVILMDCTYKTNRFRMHIAQYLRSYRQQKDNTDCTLLSKWRERTVIWVGYEMRSGASGKDGISAPSL